jgi:hypothetical protein
LLPKCYTYAKKKVHFFISILFPFFIAGSRDGHGYGGDFSLFAAAVGESSE